MNVLLSEINECDSSPCAYGVCTDQLNFFDCTCDAGWMGSHCGQGKAVRQTHYSDITMSAMASLLTTFSTACDCLPNGLFRRTSNKTSKLRATGPCEGNPPGRLISSTLILDAQRNLFQPWYGEGQSSFDVSSSMYVHIVLSCLIAAGFPHNGQWRKALMFSLICAWTNGVVNHRDAGNFIAMVLIMTLQ